METVQQVHAASEVGIANVGEVGDLAERFFCYSWLFWAGIRDIYVTNLTGLYCRALIIKRDCAVFHVLDDVTAII
ncbi:MAG TPA: hypothetical protein PLM24_09405 [Methanothrix sp.]|nr:hypothetical protein [Methanothrix sp.]HPR67335.1 hypothetical protein [Methanothrix sp.]